MKSESDTIQEENTWLLDQFKMMQKQNNGITGELSNKVVNHARAEEEILKLNTMASENIRAIEEMRKKNDKAMTENSDLQSKLNFFCLINERALNNIENSSGQVASFRIKLKGLNNANHQMK